MLTYRFCLGPLMFALLGVTSAFGQNQNEDLEFVGDGEIPALEEVQAPPAAAETVPSPAAAARDTEPPRIDDIAVAAANPNMAPMITAVITDDFSGVDRALFFYRVSGATDFAKAVLIPGAGGLFLARLPDGTQNKGFDYYVEVYDAVNETPTRIGSADMPLFVPAASAGTTLTSSYAEDDLEDDNGGWIMLSVAALGVVAVGTGVVLMTLNADAQ